MTTLSRRSVLRNSLVVAAAGTMARPYPANAAATTAEVWWTQGFAQEEDISFKKIVADYDSKAKERAEEEKKKAEEAKAQAAEARKKGKR